MHNHTGIPSSKSERYFHLSDFMKTLITEAGSVNAVKISWRTVVHLNPEKGCAHVITAKVDIKGGGTIEFEGYCDGGNGASTMRVPPSARLAIQNMEALCRIHGIPLQVGSGHVEGRGYLGIEA